jgi:hypothetical protein
MKILSGKFDAKLGIENIFRLTTGNKSLHGDNGVGITAPKRDEIIRQWR